MSSTIKPIRVWGQAGPNPGKIPMILELLSLPYEQIPVPLSQVKDPKYTENINPNGRVPAIQDPNTGILLWESGAIIEYLVETYDNGKQISFEPGSQEQYAARQWLFFQVSGQGPYYGQAAWFKTYHPEKIQSAIDRYNNEMKRVTGVLDTALSKQAARHGNAGNGPWLAGNKMSFADVAFVMWQSLITLLDRLHPGFEEDEFPFVKEWMAKLRSNEKIGKALEASMAASHESSEWQGFDKYLS